MINLMVANYFSGSKYSLNNFYIDLACQIENSLDLGWQPKDIYILANFDYSYKGICAIETDFFNPFCLTGSKMFGMQQLLESFVLSDEEIIWAHDLDAWQNIWFDPPKIKDVGICQYSRPKFNGGSIFWKKSGKDIIDTVIKEINLKVSPKEEPIIDSVFKSEEFKKRISIINNSYNVGCSGFKERYGRGSKPIKVCHFHPKNRLAWKTFVLDRHKYGCSVITPRLRRLLERFYGKNIQ